MLCHFLNRGIEPKKIINLPLSEKLFIRLVMRFIWKMNMKNTKH